MLSINSFSPDGTFYAMNQVVTESDMTSFTTTETLAQIISRPDFMQDICTSFDRVDGADCTIVIHWNPNPDLIKFDVVAK